MVGQAAPDFKDSKWKVSHFTDCYYDPVAGKQVFIKSHERLRPQNERLRKELKNFWYAQATRYISKDGKESGFEISFFKKYVRVKCWSPADDLDNATYAILLDEEWRVLGAGEKWEITFACSDDRLESVGLFLNRKLIETLVA